MCLTDQAFSKAFAVLRGSTYSSGCEKTILFMTDGESDVVYSAVRAEAAELGVRIFTYTLGDGADTSTSKQIACENDGVFRE